MSTSAVYNPRPTRSATTPRTRLVNTHTVAVIDDNRTWVETVSEMLREEGFDVRAVTDGEQAVELLDRIRPDLIILDVDLPGISGLAVLKDFRRRDRATPVLVVSGEDRASVQDRAMHDGASGFLQKPVPGAILLRAVRRLMSRAVGESKPETYGTFGGSSTIDE